MASKKNHLIGGIRDRKLIEKAINNEKMNQQEILSYIQDSKFRSDFLTNFNLKDENYIKKFFEKAKKFDIQNEQEKTSKKEIKKEELSEKEEKKLVKEGKLYSTTKNAYKVLKSYGIEVPTKEDIKAYTEKGDVLEFTKQEPKPKIPYYGISEPEPKEDILPKKITIVAPPRLPPPPKFEAPKKQLTIMEKKRLEDLENAPKEKLTNIRNEISKNISNFKNWNYERKVTEEYWKLKSENPEQDETERLNEANKRAFSRKYEEEMAQAPRRPNTFDIDLKDLGQGKNKNKKYIKDKKAMSERIVGAGKMSSMEKKLMGMGLSGGQIKKIMKLGMLDKGMGMSGGMKHGGGMLNITHGGRKMKKMMEEEEEMTEEEEEEMPMKGGRMYGGRTVIDPFFGVISSEGGAMNPAHPEAFNDRRPMSKLSFGNGISDKHDRKALMEDKSLEMKEAVRRVGTESRRELDRKMAGPRGGMKHGAGMLNITHGGRKMKKMMEEEEEMTEEEEEEMPMKGGRKPNAFIAFSNKHRAKVRAQMKDAPMKEVMKKLGEMYRAQK
jgi:hypothetical protein